MSTQVERPVAPALDPTATPAAPLSIDEVVVDDLQPGQWMAMHIFYTSNPTPLLVECVAPAVAELRERGLIERFFFIRYWLEGPHTRVRVKPSDVAHVPEIRRILETAVDAFLARRPAVYEVDVDLTSDLYKQMFLTEYSEEQWEERYGDGSSMQMQRNNSRAYIEYVPEYDRYGGPVGIELAEWHFEHSSDMALRLVKTTNVHVRSVLFGLGVQLMAVLVFTMLREPASSARFLLGYSRYWESSYQDGNARHDVYDDVYASMAPTVRARVREIYQAVTEGRLDRLTGFVHDWAVHCAELRDRITEHTERGEMVFQAWENADQRVPAGDVTLVFRVLLSSFVHMTDNRMGITIHDEIYLSYVLRKAIQDELLDGVEVSIEAFR